MDFACETDVDLEGFIFAGTFRDLVGLQSFFLEVGKSGAYSLAFFIIGEDTDNEGELFRL